MSAPALQVRTDDAVLADATLRFLERMAAPAGSRPFFRVEGFDEPTYAHLLDALTERGDRLGDRPLLTRTTSPLPGHEAYAMQPGTSATWYRNNVPEGHALLCLFTGEVSDWQGLKDIFAVTEAVLSRQGFPDLVEAAFEQYQLSDAERKELRDLLRVFGQEVYDPQLRDLVRFLRAVDNHLAEEPSRLPWAVGKALHHLGLFANPELAALAGKRKVLRRHFRDNARASALGREHLDATTRRKLLAALDDAHLDSVPGGLSADEKRGRIERFLRDVNTSREAIEQALVIEWREVAPILHKRARPSKPERARQDGEDLVEALDEAGYPTQDYDEETQTLVDALLEGETPEPEAVEDVLETIGDELPKELVTRLRRYRKPKTLKSSDFVEGLTTLCIDLLSATSPQEGTATLLTVTAKPCDKPEEVREMLLAFRTLFSGVEAFFPSITWELSELNAALRELDIAPVDSEDDEAKTNGTLSFRVVATDGDGETLARGTFEWTYVSENTAGATTQHLLAEAGRVTNEGAERSAPIPIYRTATPPDRIADLDLGKPIHSLSAWYRDADSRLSLRDVLRETLRGRVRPKVERGVLEALSSLEQAWGRWLDDAARDGVFAADLDALLDALDALYHTALNQFEHEAEAANGFPPLAAAWLVGPESFDSWAVVPLLHPVKLLWWRERARRFGVFVEALVARGSDAMVDESLLKQELANTYSSSHFPAVLALEGRDGVSRFFLPVTEEGGYELFQREEQAALAFGLDTDTATDSEAKAAAKTVAHELGKVVHDYVETYPFVRDGLDVYIAGCRNGAFPGHLAEAISKAVGYPEPQLNIVVHSPDRGAPLYARASAWARTQVEERAYGALFPDQSIKVVECGYEELVEQADDADIVVLADVLPERGQQVTAERVDAVEDVSVEGYFPLHRAVQRPYSRARLSRSVRLTPAEAPRVIHHFNAVQAAAKEKKPHSGHAVAFERSVNLGEWRQELTAYHDQFTWVACYDTAVDRHLLKATFPGTVDVIRYSSGLGRLRQHSLTVSSAKGADSIVCSRLAANLEGILPGTLLAQRMEISKSLINDAKDISGDLILRAAGPGTYLNELIGVVAAKREVEARYREHALPGAATAWILLDDYAHWFKRKMPDLLFVALEADDEGRPSLHLEVVEAKCVSEGCFEAEVKDAQHQVAQGVGRLAEAWFPQGHHLDAPFWANQLLQALAGSLVLTLEHQQLWDRLERGLADGSYTLDMTGATWAFCYDHSVIQDTTRPDLLTTQAASVAPEFPSIPHHVHRVGARRLRDVLRATLQGGGGDGAAPSGTTDPVLGTPQATRGPVHQGDGPESHEPPPPTPTPANAERSLASKGEPASPATAAPEVGASDPSSPLSSSPPQPSQASAGNSQSQSPQPTEGTASPQDLPSDGLAEWIEETAGRLSRALRHFEISAYPVDAGIAEVGPSIARFKTRLRPGEKLTRVQNAAKDLQRELLVATVPLVDNVPGEPYVGIDVPHPHPQAVPFAEYSALLDSSDAALPLLVGVDPGGEVTVADLATMPHLLVGGSTGSGKTVFLHSLLLSLVHRHGPDTLRLVLVDPKQTDFSFFEGLPHLEGGHVILEPEDAIVALDHLTQHELQARTAKLREAGCPNIADYNAMRPDDALPYSVVVIDEYADLVHVLSGKDREAFESRLVRLAQRARNVGIHLVIATQRPSADIVTSKLKANLPTRIAFLLPSYHDSNTILDSSGAENLVGKGDMLAKLDGQMRRLQGFYTSPQELRGLRNP